MTANHSVHRLIIIVALAAITLTDIPLLALVILISLPLTLGALEPLQHEQATQDDCIQLYASALTAGALTGLLFCAALIAGMII